MRTAIILGRRHGATELEIISGPSVPIVRQLEQFKSFRRDPVNGDFERVELWTSDGGRIKQRSLAAPSGESSTETDRPDAAGTTRKKTRR